MATGFTSRTQSTPHRYEQEPTAEKHKGPQWVNLGGARAMVDDEGEILKACPGLKGESLDSLDENRDEREDKQEQAEEEGWESQKTKDLRNTWEQAKKQAPEAIVVVRSGEKFFSFGVDVAQLNELSQLGGEGEDSASFDADKLDHHLGRMIEAGHRVAVVDRSEDGSPDFESEADPDAKEIVGETRQEMAEEAPEAEPEVRPDELAAFAQHVAGAIKNGDPVPDGTDELMTAMAQEAIRNGENISATMKRHGVDPHLWGFRGALADEVDRQKEQAKPKPSPARQKAMDRQQPPAAPVAPPEPEQPAQAPVAAPQPSGTDRHSATGAQLQNAPNTIQRLLQSMHGLRDTRKTGSAVSKDIGADYAKGMHDYLKGIEKQGDGFGDVYDLSKELGHGALGYASPAGNLVMIPPMMKSDDWEVRYSLANPEVQPHPADAAPQAAPVQPEAAPEMAEPPAPPAKPRRKKPEEGARGFKAPEFMEAMTEAIGEEGASDAKYREIFTKHAKEAFKDVRRYNSEFNRGLTEMFAQYKVNPGGFIQAVKKFSGTGGDYLSFVKAYPDRVDKQGHVIKGLGTHFEEMADWARIYRPDLLTAELGTSSGNLNDALGAPQLLWNTFTREESPYKNADVKPYDPEVIEYAKELYNREAEQAEMSDAHEQLMMEDPDYADAYRTKRAELDATPFSRSGAKDRLHKWATSSLSRWRKYRKICYGEGWNEKEHPRGQPDNAGEFAEKEGGAKPKPAAEDTASTKQKNSSAITDEALKQKLESGPKIKVFRAMQLVDGNLYPPMSGKVGNEWRNPTQIGEWEQAVEMPELADDKGFFTLNKGNKKSIKARYNPYFHTSLSPLNDQFSEAYNRPNLVTVEVEVPESELTSGYKADKAKDSVGKMSWHSGPVSGKLPSSKKRVVILSRYAKVLRIVPDSEVADHIAKLLEGENITIPYNVITPSLKDELIARGVAVTEKDSPKLGQKYSQLRDDVLRYVKQRYPLWYAKQLAFSFDEDVHPRAKEAVTIGSTSYTPGEFIPKEKAAAATPEEKEKIADAPPEQPAAKTAVSPKPLPEAPSGDLGNEELVMKAKAGDQGAAAELVTKNRKFIVSFAKRYARNEDELDDLVQEGSIAILRAIDSFNPEKGFKFTTHAGFAIKGAVSSAAKKMHKGGKQQLTDQEDQSSAIDQFAEKKEQATRFSAEAMDRLEKEVHLLPEEQQKVISMKFGFGRKEPMDYREIATALKISKSQAHKLASQGMQDLAHIMHKVMNYSRVRDLVQRYYKQRRPDKYAALRDAVLRYVKDHYAKKKSSPGQMSLFTEDDHPRAKEAVTIGSTEYVPGEFIPKDKAAQASPAEAEKIEGMPEAAKQAEPAKEPEKPRPVDQWTPEERIADWKANNIRGESFKAFFGDWENNPKDASKVVDPKTGEPQETSNIPGTGSMVKDDEGNPIAVYHGTSHGGFDAFDKEKIAKENLFGPGFYFTEDADVADTYMDKGADDALMVSASVASKIEKGIEDFLPDGWKVLQHSANSPDKSNQVELQSPSGETLKLFDREGTEAFAFYDDMFHAIPERALKLDDTQKAAWTKMFNDAGIEEKIKEVKSVYLNIRKPFRVDEPVSKNPDTLRRLEAAVLARLDSGYWPAIGDSGPSKDPSDIAFDKSELKRFFKGYEGSEATPEAILASLTNYVHGVEPDGSKFGKQSWHRLLQEAGYDGITHIGGDRMGGGHKHRVWIAFEPSQVKGTDNQGTFDPNDDRLKYSQTGE